MNLKLEEKDGAGGFAVKFYLQKWQPTVTLTISGDIGATGCAARAVVQENFDHAGRDGGISWADSGNF